MNLKKTIFNLKIKAILFAIIFIFILLLGSYVAIISSKFYIAHPDNITVIKRGSNMGEVINILEENGCKFNSLYFSTIMRITGKDHKIKFGRYNFKGINTLGDLIRLITTESSERIKVTLIEGWTINEIAGEIEKKCEIDIKKFINLCSDYNFINTLGVNAPTLEGVLFPDTYILLKSYTEEDIIQVMVNQYNYNYDKYIKDAGERINFSKLEITTLASIIQGEAMDGKEMPIISSVYHNRLIKKMYLQADPTIQYIIPGENRRLYNKDLKVDSPYNTYKYKGLPPGPINNPGLAALIAAIKPDKTDYLYFVADGSGKHIFSKTNSEHNRAKKHLFRKRKGL